MSRVYAFLADGFEETEAIAVIDLIKRGGIDIEMVSVMGRKEVVGAHNIKIEADSLVEDIDIDNADMLFLPGGMPGTTNLAACTRLCDAIVRYNNTGKKLAAICAAPSVFGELGVLEGKKATCYPGFEEKLKGATYVGDKAVTDKNVSTARGMGAAIELGLEIVRVFEGEEKSKEVAESIRF